MNMHTSIALLVILLTGGNSLECYNCSEYQQEHCEQQCDNSDLHCASKREVEYDSGTRIETNEIKGCVEADFCKPASRSDGSWRKAVYVKCCDTDFCNDQVAPELNVLNGKKCYACDWQSCLITVNCWGNEDYCFTLIETGYSQVTVKGCASKSVCDGESDMIFPELQNISCCQGNLCNSATSITHDLLLLSWPLIFYIMFH